MTTNRRRFAALFIAVIALAMVAAACGSEYFDAK